jgi:acetyltransferase-like isoleucine patch superfamily enzyme
LDQNIKDRLIEAGIEVLWPPGAVSLPEGAILEPPCSIKWMRPQYRFELGAFSYAVSGFFFDVSIGRYCSMGEDLQFGRGDHPKTWLSTSPFQYLPTPLFNVGQSFEGSAAYHAFRAPSSPVAPVTHRPITVGNDVWVGHAAFVRPGVTIGDGSIVAANAVVTRDVAPYTIVAGNPARVVGQRFPDSIVAELMALKWWRFAPWQLQGAPFHDIRAAVDFLTSELRDKAPYEPAKVTLQDLAAAR